MQDGPGPSPGPAHPAMPIQLAHTGRAAGAARVAAAAACAWRKCARILLLSPQIKLTESHPWAEYQGMEQQHFDACDLAVLFRIHTAPRVGQVDHFMARAWRKCARVLLLRLHIKLLSLTHGPNTKGCNHSSILTHAT